MWCSFHQHNKNSMATDVVLSGSAGGGVDGGTLKHTSRSRQSYFFVATDQSNVKKSNRYLRRTCMLLRKLQSVWPAPTAPNSLARAERNEYEWFFFVLFLLLFIFIFLQARSPIVCVGKYKHGYGWWTLHYYLSTQSVKVVGSSLWIPSRTETFSV